MATPGDTLRSQAEVRLKLLARRVAAHRKVKGGDVAALLELVWRDAPMPVEKVFSKNPNGRQRGSKRRLDLFAVAVFQNAHYTAFVRASDGSDSWTYHDRRAAVAVGAFANVVQRCRDGPMLPYLLFYDALPAPPGN